MPPITNEVTYLILIVGLLVVPRMLQRFRIPAPLTCLGFGMAAALVLNQISDDATLSLLATLGISSLFLFAGLEIDVHALKRGMKPLIGHLIVRGAILGASAWVGMRYFALSWQVAILLALALLTPSTGFILDTLGRLGLNEDERFWVTIKAVGGELLALLILFGVLQSASAATLVWASAGMLAMIVLLPLFFIVLGRVVVPYAHGSEFSLLVMVGLIAAYLSKELGVYYLVGAFLAGFVARLLRERMPALASDDNLHAVGLFASFFVPFYFFYSGMKVPAGAFRWEALMVGMALAATILPFRIGGLWLQRRFIKGESAIGSLRVSVALTPTLIFTLVLAAILRERFGMSDTVYGALLVYAAISTALPSFLLAKPIDFDVLDYHGPPEPAHRARNDVAGSPAQAFAAPDGVAATPPATPSEPGREAPRV